VDALGPQIELVDTADCQGNFLIVLEGVVTYGGTTAQRNTVLHMKRGAVFDPTFNKVTTDRLILPNVLQGGTSVAGVLEIKHTTGSIYEFAHSNNDAEAVSSFTHANGSFKHRVDAGAFRATAAATNSGSGAVMIGATTRTTVGAAGGASALPATPTGYLIINVAGTERQIPFYTVP